MTSATGRVGAALSPAARLRPTDAAWAFALRAGLAVAAPLVILVALGEPSWAATAALGSFTALYARDELYRPRAGQLALVALGLVGSVAVGTLAALAPRPAIAGVVAVAVVGAVATWLCTALRVGPPAGLMFAFATAVAGAVPAVPADLWRGPALTAAAAAWAWLVAMAGAAVDRDAPRRLAVARALRAVAAMESAPRGSAGLQARHRAAVAIERAWRALAVPPAAGPRGALIADLEALVARAESAFAAVHVTGAAASRGWYGKAADEPRREVADGPERNRATAPVDWAALRTLAEQVGRAGPVPRVRRSRAEIAEVAGRHLAAEIGERRHLLRRDYAGAEQGRIRLGGPAVPVAGRVALGALIAGAAAALLARDVGLGHAYWAAVSAVAVLQTPNLLGSVHRTLQRAVGTLAGVLIAGAAITLLPGQWAFAAAIVALQVVAELLVVRNYGLAMLAVTPLAILVGELAHASSPTELIRDRVLQTVLGCVVGLLCAFLVRNRAAVRHLEATTAACRAAVDELHARLADPAGDPGPAARRVAALLSAVREAYDVTAGEPGRTRTDAQVVLRTEQRARHALALFAGRRPAEPTARQEREVAG